MSTPRTSKAGFGWLLKMAWRDGRASWGRILLFMASTILGIAAVVSIQSFSDTLKDNIALQSKELMGADFTIDTDKKPNERVTFLMDSLGGYDAREVSFASMASFSNTDQTRLVRVRGIEGNFPFYGSLETEPATAAANYQSNGGALVDATLMMQFGISPGDTINLGEISLPVLGALEKAPGSTSMFGAIAPPVIIPHQFIGPSQLVQLGSRVDYNFYFEDTTTNLELLDQKVDPILDDENADMDTHTSTSSRLGRRYENFGKFLNLVAFIALLLGCVGIASSIHIYIKEKLPSAALLKCLGASRKQTFMIYLLQIAFMGLLGGILGVVIGLLLQQLFPYFLEDLLPVSLSLSISVPAVVSGLLLGVLMSVLFALYPLLSTLGVSPLATLRKQDTQNALPKKWGWGVFALILLSIFLISLWLLDNAKYAIWFVVGIAITFAILSGVAHLFMQGIKKFFPKHWNFEARQSLLNLFRPQNQTLILILAIGVGSFLISTLYFTKDMLLQEATLADQQDNPNIVLLDVQSDQREGVAQTIEGNEMNVISDIPIVTMRVASIKGRSVNDLRRDTTSTINRWVLSHEFRTTYRDHMVKSETLLEGEFIDSASRQGVIPISVSENFARDTQTNVGDTVAFNIQGVVMTTEVKSIRTVDWSRMEPNFNIVFPAGILENAPQFRVFTTKAGSETVSAQFQQQLVKLYPNISVLDLRQLLSILQDLLAKISWIINFIASFSIFTGIIVLFGAIRSTKFQRTKESVLLRTLGAKGKQITKIVALEYLYLGALGSLIGILLSLIGCWLLAWFAFETTFTPSWFPFLVLFPAITLLTLFIGWSNSRGVIKSPPLQVLRRGS
ncbi:ABC transporter permease [Robertkochia sediminum]|uniref:ABC transporter permease n=1 Tax=Robertkochia sediminum TaxID=2785326 RepID=UPI00193303D4|nr:FtsX-like permease family protein [Robertkochia sediminum]MBL7471429.1 ABC transporter permease [Robertkochia sediminum]